MALQILLMNFSARKFLSVVAAAAVVCAAVAAYAADDAYRAGVEKWRRDYETALRAEDGWLSVAGLFWLHEGENKFGSDPLNDIAIADASVPVQVGSFDMHDGKIVVRINSGIAVKFRGNSVDSAAILPDSADRISLGDVSLMIHRSGERYAVRVKNKNSKYRREFAGLHWFPIDENYRVKAKFTAYEAPHATLIQNLAGDTVKIASPGYAEFKLAGQEYRLEAFEEEGMLWFVFRDLTSGKETYAASRFLHAAPAKDGIVVMDFNEAFAMHVFTTRSSCRGVIGCSEEIDGGSTSRILAITLAELLPSNAFCPSPFRTRLRQMRKCPCARPLPWLRLVPAPCTAKCPRIVPSFVMAFCIVGSCEIRSGRSNLLRQLRQAEVQQLDPDLVSMMLPGLRSRWVMPLRCALSSASAISIANCKTCWIGSAPFCNRCASVSPSMYSITRKSCRPDVPCRRACRCGDDSGWRWF